jgi:hypothetical protein
MDYNGHGPGHYNRRLFQISGVTPVTKQSKHIFAYNDIFYSCSEFKNDIFYSVLQYIGPAADAAKYKYKLEFVSMGCEENLTVTLLARSLDEDLNEVYNSGKCVKLYPVQYNRFANDWNELTFSLDIFTVGSGPGSSIGTATGSNTSRRTPVPIQPRLQYVPTYYRP